MIDELWMQKTPQPKNAPLSGSGPWRSRRLTLVRSAAMEIWVTMELLLVCDPGKAQQSSWSFALTCPLTCDSEWLDQMMSCNNFGQGLRWVVPTVPLFINLQNTMISESCITWELGHPWFRDSRALQLFGSTASDVFQPQRQVPHTIPFTISPCDCAQKNTQQHLL